MEIMISLRLKVNEVRLQQAIHELGFDTLQSWELMRVVSLTTSTKPHSPISLRTYYCLDFSCVAPSVSKSSIDVKAAGVSVLLQLSILGHSRAALAHHWRIRRDGLSQGSVDPLNRHSTQVQTRSTLSQRSRCQILSGACASICFGEGIFFEPAFFDRPVE